MCERAQWPKFQCNRPPFFLVLVVLGLDSVVLIPSTPEICFFLYHFILVALFCFILIFFAEGFRFTSRRRRERMEWGPSLLIAISKLFLRTHCAGLLLVLVLYLSRFELGVDRGGGGGGKVLCS